MPNTIPKSADLLQGTVIWPAGKVFENQWGKSQSITVSINGQEEKIWFKEGLQPHASLKKGQQIKLLASEQNGKTRYTIISDTPDNNQQQSPAAKKYQLADEDKRAIAEYISQQSKILRFCIEQASKECGDITPSEESVRSLGVSLYIAAQRKFGL